MRNFTSFFLFLSFVFSTVADAQISLSTNSRTRDNVQRCYTVQQIAAERQLNPKAETDAQFEARLMQVMQSITARTTIDYTLPVVFHVIHNGEAVGTDYNISSALIQSQLHQINKDFANQSNSPYSVAANTGIQFRMATKDPSNILMLEAGIDRVDRNALSFSDPGTAGWSTSYIASVIKPSTIWNPSRYINIWILPISGNILGFATFPASSGLSGISSTETASTAGVCINYFTVGSIANPAEACNVSGYNLGRTCTHELGHFFGLRHIWGDANCATDYCNDTPVHFDENGGVPTHPKPNSCGTPDEMFENYMDYTDDLVTNTFTADQVARMQAVMLVSPRRAELTTSAAGLGVTTSNKISFLACATSMSVSEKATSGSFPGYRDVAVLLNTEYRATGAATVTVAATGTASSTTDYQVLNPSITYAAGDANKYINVRIHDDGLVETNKTIILNYTISGSGVTAAAANQTFTITLLDDDGIRPSEIPVTIINESFGTSGGTVPVGWTRLSTGGANQFTVSTNGSAGGSGQVVHITNDQVAKPNIYTKTASGAAVIRTPLIDATGLTNMNFQYKYRVAGEVIGNTAQDYGLTTWSTEAVPNTFFQIANTPVLASNTPIQGTLNVAVPGSFSGTKFYLSMYWSNNASAGNDPGLNVDDVVITADGTKIETALNASNTFAVPVTSTVNFKSSQNSKLLAQIKNSNTALPQVNVSIIEAGNDRPTFTTTSGVFMRTRKVFKITPTPGNTTATYQATFYFTATEMAAWGGSAANLKFLKVSDATDLTLPVVISGSIITPTAVDNKLATDGYIAYTGDFTGFSKFAMVEAVATIPVTWLNFSGSLQGNLVKLNWATATEINNKGFEVERSTDGTTFSKIAWVNGLNGTNVNTYTLNDFDLTRGNRYYYRLKQVDLDERYNYSSVVSIAYLGKDKSISFFPNPVKDLLVIQNNTLLSGGHVSITDINGRLMYSNPALQTGRTEISTSNWSAGVYTISIAGKNAEVLSYKLVKD